MEDLRVSQRSRGSFLPRTASHDLKNSLVCELNAIHQSSFRLICFHSHFIAACDEENVIYILNMKTGKYKALVFELSSIETFNFMYSNPDQLIIAFSDKSIVILFWRTNTIVEQLESPTLVHKILNYAGNLVLVLDSGAVAMIDIKSRRLLRELNTGDPCIQIDIDHNYIFILSQTYGLNVYSNKSYLPIIQTTLNDDHNTNNFQWISYCRFSLSKKNVYKKNIYCFVLLGSDGSLYLWTANLDKIQALQEKRILLADNAASMEEAIACELAGNLIIPTEHGVLKSVVYINDNTSTKRCIACMTSRGKIMIISLELDMKSPLNITALKWTYSILRITLDMDYQHRQQPLHNIVIGHVEEDLNHWILGLNAGRISIIDFDSRLLTARFPLVFKTHINTSVFTIPSPHNIESETIEALHRGSRRISISTPSTDLHTNEHQSAQSRRFGSKQSGVGVGGNGGTYRKRRDSHGGSSLDSLSLFELATLKPKEKRLNTQILHGFFAKHGEFPDKYRTFIWRFLLRLPENNEAFSKLAQNGIHKSYQNLKSRYPVKPDKLFERLQYICSYLATYSAIFGDIDYLPHIVFPFLIVFEKDEIACLETVMTIFLWWGHSWFVTYPNPPLNIIDSISDLLQLYDKNLYGHMMKNLDISPGIIGWGLISTLFTEILTRNDWLKIMDCVFLHYENTQTLTLLAVAIIRELRAPILEVGKEKARNFQLFFTQNVTINISKVMELTKVMMRRTSKSKLSADANVPLNEFAEGYNSHMTLSDIEQLRRNMALDLGAPIFPLPKGHYPIFSGYPLTQENGEISDRNNILELRNVVAERKDIVERLEEKLDEHSQDHLAWMLRQKEKTAAELAIREQQAALEKQHMNELLKVEEKIAERKVDAMRAMKEFAKIEMALVDEMQAKRVKALEVDSTLIEQKRRFDLRIAKLRAISEQAESRAEEELRAIYNSRGVVDEEFGNAHISELRAKEGFRTDDAI